MAISFKGAHFPPDIILMGVRWYVAYPLSYRHVEGFCREFYLGGHEGAVALVCEEITPPGSRTVQPQYGLRLPLRPPAAVS